MFQMMSLSNDVTESNNFFVSSLENSIVLNRLIFNQIQTSFCHCLRVSSDLMFLWISSKSVP